MALESWEIKALEHDLLDYNSWATHAVNEDIYSDTETALHAKASKCAKRMINSHESLYGSIANEQVSEKVDACHAHINYKNRITRDEEVI